MSAVMIAASTALIASSMSHSSGSYSSEPMPDSMIPFMLGTLGMIAMLIPMIICMAANMESKWGSKRERWSERGVHLSLGLAALFPVVGGLVSGIWAIWF